MNKGYIAAFGGSLLLLAGMGVSYLLSNNTIQNLLAQGVDTYCAMPKDGRMQLRETVASHLNGGKRIIIDCGDEATQ